MIIAQISDTHIALDTPDAERRRHDLALTIADINSLDPPADAIVHTGDIVHSGSEGEYAMVAATLAAARAPVYFVAGNKDDRTRLRAVFSGTACFAPGADFVDYAVDVFPIRLVVLDTIDPAGNKGDFCPERVARLRELVDREVGKPIAVFTHHPPFEVTVGPERLHFATPEKMSLLCDALQRSSRVAAVFSGHVHRAAVGRIGSIAASVAPCVATTLRYGEYPPHMKIRPVYQIHRFDPTGRFSSETRIV